ncbi:L-lactate dehydrogenase [Neobacillus rhizophilus]|uniref:L-lactate dehydrogenase n=1 Tax=Neobacillus rhizophilus TaxID=2833579 RepID=A0A942UAM9_9BACI|nr:L-lactate dehydrogenase [Neobacillus rhizophilus]MBS4216665.1 L-lactate dehydrogenase [Neobacillus rhizophilus]MBU8920115.1 L-lactate dehydrogenase [Bacillus sp. FJAT-29953]
MKRNKLVVVGVGHVGSYVLADAMKLGLFAEIAVIDIDKDVAFGEALDQAHATALTYMSNTSVRAGDYSECADADVIICAAGPSMLKSEGDKMPDRAQLAAVNAEVIREVMTGIKKHTKEAIIILITNPLDTMVYIAENEFGYPKGRVFGTGTMLDSARLRKIIADNYDIDPKSVTGYMMGEHGHTAFPVLSRLNVQGFGEKELDQVFQGKEPLSRERVKQQVVKAAFDVLNGKGWTNAGVAQAAVTLAKAVLLDERSAYPVCTTLHGQYGYDGDVALSMPCIVGRNGVEQQLEIALDDQEMEWLHQSAEYIKEAMKVAKTGKIHHSL